MASNQTEALVFLSRELPIICRSPVDGLPISCLDMVRNALIQGTKTLGYEYVRYSYWLKDIVNGDAPKNSFSVNISNFPSDWENFYNNQSLYLHDPIVRIIQNKVAKHLVYGTWGDAYLWAMQEPLGDTAEQRRDYINNITKLIADSREYDLMSGYYYSWGDEIRQIVLSLASSKSTIENHSGADQVFIQSLHSMVILANQSIQMTQGCRHCNKSLRVDGGAPIRLTSAELAILALYCRHRNATQKQIAAECKRSVDTVNHHLRSIRRKLNIPSASGHALAAYAAELNLL